LRFLGWDRLVSWDQGSHDSSDGFNSQSQRCDVDGILHVSAEDKGSGNKESITITNDKGRLSEEDIQRMVKEAEEAAEEDKAARQRVEAKNQLENYAYQIRNILNDEEKSAKLDSEDRETLDSAVKETIEWVEENQGADKDDFDAQYKKLEKVAQPIFSKLYQNGGAPGGGSIDDFGSHDEL